MKMFSHSPISVLVIAVVIVLVVTFSEIDESDEDEREYFISDSFKTYSHYMGRGEKRLHWQ